MTATGVATAAIASRKSSSGLASIIICTVTSPYAPAGRVEHDLVTFCPHRNGRQFGCGERIVESRGFGETDPIGLDDRSLSVSVVDDRSPLRDNPGPFALRTFHMLFDASA